MSDEPSAKPDVVNYLLSPKTFLLEAPPYQEFELSIAGRTVFEHLISLINVDAYCVYCDRDSVFARHHDPFLEKLTTNSSYDLWRDNKQFNRLRTKHADYVVFFLKQQNSIQKIGQFPSVADFQIPQVAKYRKILGEDKYKEFTRGLGLFAHGVGIGSFVYLRRIFEHLIEAAHTAAQQDAGFDEDKYRVAPMDEKIAMLRNHLPSFLVQNKHIYGILSIGIHQLSESECLKYFQPVRIGIELILDETIIQTERKRKEEQVQADISKIVQKLR